MLLITLNKSARLINFDPGYQIPDAGITNIWYQASEIWNPRKMRKLSMSELNRPSVEEHKARKKRPVVVVLDNIRSLHNVGSLFRTADAFNLEAILLCGITATPPHREIHRTALGATESVDWEYYPTSQAAVKKLKKKGYQIVVIEQTDKSIPLSKITLESDTQLALIFGNEITGVSEEVLDNADMAIEIPQFGTKHSLNVAVSAGIVIWELLRKNVK